MTSTTEAVDTTGTTTTTTAIDTHLRAYCEPDATVRADLVASVWHPAGRLIDPPFDATGHDDISAMTEAVLAHYPAHTFVRTTDVDEHHTFARYGWSLVGARRHRRTGTDVVEFDDDGRTCVCSASSATSPTRRPERTGPPP